MTKEQKALTPLATISNKLREKDFAEKILKAIPEQTASSFPEKIATHVMMEISENSALANCKWKSIAKCVLECSALGLFPSKLLGHIYLVPFKDQATIIVGYKGIIQLFLRDPKVSRVKAKVVRSHDEFKVIEGTEDKIIHNPNLKERGEITHVYAIVFYTDGSNQFEWMDRAEIDEAKNQAKTQKFWKPYFKQMALKTVVRRLDKYLPFNALYEKALEIEHETEIDPDEGSILDGEYRETQSDEALINLLEEGRDD
jgi:recombination protein RecT